ncbi:MAG: PRC-barrel domain-containing protein [Syntrophomonadaceae bacterium]
MRVRNLKNLPVFCNATAQVAGRVERGVIGDDFTLAYVIVELPEGEMKLILPPDIKLSDEALVIESIESMKSYLYGEELSIYSKKIGDSIYNFQGQELGIVSDFVITGDLRVQAVEVSGGVIQDLLNGRKCIPVKEIDWKSIYSGVVDQEGS